MSLLARRHCGELRRLQSMSRDMFGGYHGDRAGIERD